MRPQKMQVDLRKGDPKNWSATVAKMTENARPTYSGDPKGRMTLPFSLQSWGPPKAADRLRSFSPQKTPPPTYLTPDEIRPTPMSMTATPVTTGGKRRLRTLAGMRLITISKRDATMAVPRNLP